MTDLWKASSGTGAQTRFKYVLIAGAIVIGIIILALVLMFGSRSFRDSLSVRSLARALPGLELYRDSKTETTVFGVADGKYVELSTGDLIVSSFTTSRGTVRIVRGSDGSYEIRNGRAVLLRSSSALIGLNGTPDGARLVYAEQSKEAAPIPMEGGIFQALPLETNEWNVVMLDVESNTTFNFGAGVHPFFVDATHIVRTSPVGIYVTDTETGQSTELLGMQLPRVAFTPLVSPDQAHMGVVPLGSMNVSVYSVSSSTITEIGSVPLGNRVISSVLGNGELYTLRAVNFGAEIWSQAFAQGAEAKRDVKLPEYLSIMRISNK